MDLELIVEPRTVVEWETFCQTAPPFSIALDGYVRGPPRYDPAGPRLNLNHHEDVDRLSTLSTSGQVHDYIKGGLFEEFQVSGIPTAHIYINDPDQDTALSTWLLFNHHRIEGYHSEPLINRLLFAQDKLDKFAGAYPFDSASELMQDIFWIFEPYTSQRHRVPSLEAAEMRSIIEAVGSRIEAHTIGKGQKRAVDVHEHYTILHQGTGWSLVEEKGPYAKTGLLSTGIKAFIALRVESPKYQYHYTIGKLIPFARFPLTELYEELNNREGISLANTDRWGGGNTIGGSPRQKGSSIHPGQLFAIVEEFLKKESLPQG